MQETEGSSFELSNVRRCIEGFQHNGYIRSHYLNPQKELDIGFNIFSIISDQFYKENFHSDVINALLCYDTKTNEKRYLFLFNQFLARLGCNVKPTDYTEANSVREKDGIDILIFNDKNKRAIIIENKINGARDQEEQLPRYYNVMVKNGYQVEAIIYISLDGRKYPSTENWKTEDKSNIVKLLKTISANDLVEGWLKNCILETTDLVGDSILKQYKDLLIYLGGKIMENVDKEELLTFIGKNYKAALIIQEFMQNFEIFRAEVMANKVGRMNIMPFEKIWIYKGICVVLHNFINNGSNFAIDIKCYPEKYSFELFDRKHYNFYDTSLALLKMIGIAEQLKPIGGRMIKEFTFPDEEDKIYEFINHFLELVRNLPE